MTIPSATHQPSLPLDRLLTDAIALSHTCHADQVDKAGNPYVSHPLRVMKALTTPAEKIVGVLHDAVEDSALTLPDLVDAGFPPRIVAAIDAITKRPNEPYETYLARVMANPIALRVKIADMTDNMDMSRIAHPTHQDWARLKKYEAILPRLQQKLKALADLGN
ncbi:GTP pyrophosphokinase [Acaryochloris sp. IP29b_bin.148]|uniref:GTP pyrophosphokinase n=1 Tax=Acaryochloris sp. IP29b_bin.148 TaxID=2969218 RepID=UPI002603B0DD|nr:GTP pyrophosphokinase [Acaryochloris sp. IP29b_bin.148]